MGRVARARRARNDLRRQLREGETPELREDLVAAELLLTKTRKARRSRRRQAWRDFVEGLGDVLGFVDGILDEVDDDTKLAQTAQAILGESKIPIDEMSRAVDLARVVVSIAETRIDDDE